MGAVIRQQYTNPNTGNKEVKEINIDIESFRPDRSEGNFSEIIVKAEPWGHWPDGVRQVTVDPGNIINELIDGKRTFRPKGIIVSRIIKESSSNKLFMDDSLGFESGHPIAIIHTFDSLKEFSIVQEVDHENKILYLISDVSTLKPGTFVQNLSTEVWKGNRITGCKSQLARPNPIAYISKSRSGSIELILSTPLNSGSLKYLDIYIKDHLFDKIQQHWLPEVSDISSSQSSVSIPTCDGKTIEPNKAYYISVISKDQIGYVNVNESNCVVEKIIL